MELINTSASPLDISHWYIDDNGGNSYYTVADHTTIYPNSCLVFNSDFNFNKSSPDSVRLFDSSSPPSTSSAKLVDSFSYTTIPASGQTYQRNPDGANWISSNNSLGKFNSSGTPCIVLPTATPSPSFTPTPFITPTEIPTPTATIFVTPTPEPINNIYISEVMANPNTNENEWVELFNNNDFDVDLQNWYVDDGENEGASPRQFSLHLSPKSYSIFTLETGILNNEGDTVRLLDENKNQKDKISYTYSEKGKSIGRIDFNLDFVCNQEPSQEKSNTSCLVVQTPTTTPFLSPPTSQNPSKPQPTLSQDPSINSSTPSTIETPSELLTDQEPIESDTAEPEISEDVNDNTNEKLSSFSKNNNHPPLDNTTPLLRSLSFLSLGTSFLNGIYSILKIKSRLGSDTHEVLNLVEKTIQNHV